MYSIESIGIELVIIILLIGFVAEPLEHAQSDISLEKEILRTKQKVQ